MLLMETFLSEYVV